MKKSRPDVSAGQSRDKAQATGSGPSGKRDAQRQPVPTGANRGSPAAPVMKQFVKTRNEGGDKT